MFAKSASAYLSRNFGAAKSLVTARRLGTAAGGAAVSGGLWWLMSPRSDEVGEDRNFLETKAGTPMMMATSFALPFLGAAMTRRFPNNRFLKGMNF
jgi:hypothetical protein